MAYSFLPCTIFCYISCISLVGSEIDDRIRNGVFHMRNCSCIGYHILDTVRANGKHFKLHWELRTIYWTEFVLLDYFNWNQRLISSASKIPMQVSQDTDYADRYLWRSVEKMANICMSNLTVVSIWSISQEHIQQRCMRTRMRKSNDSHNTLVMLWSLPLPFLCYLLCSTPSSIIAFWIRERDHSSYFHRLGSY